MGKSNLGIPSLYLHSPHIHNDPLTKDTASHNTLAPPFDRALAKNSASETKGVVPPLTLPCLKIRMEMECDESPLTLSIDFEVNKKVQGEWMDVRQWLTFPKQSAIDKRITK